MERFIDQTLRVTITDGRIIQGTLKCVDNTLNLILVDAVNTLDHQNLGPVIIPGQHVKNCKLFKPTE